VQNEMHAFQK